MGEIADMMLDGMLCEGCGDFIGEAIGHLRRCSRPACRPSLLQNALKRPLHPTPNARLAERHNRARHEKARERKPFECSKCPRLFRTEAGRNQHTHDVHNKAVR